MSFIIFPKINGITIRKENFAAFVLSFPKITEVEIVDPDLEIPGKLSAIAWAIPITIAFLDEISLVVFFALSARRSSCCKD